MFRILKSAVILGLLFALGACGILNRTKKRAEQPLHDVQKFVEPQSGKEVVIVRMRHLGAQSGYEQVRDYLDKLKLEGYVTFCEGVVPVPFHIDTVGDVTRAQLLELGETYRPSGDDSLRLDTLYRKCRRMLGFMLNDKGYADTDNQSLEITRKEKEYVSQSDEELGLTGERDFWVDYSLRDLVEVCEKKYGGIELTDYDFQTGLFEKYAPEKRPAQRPSSYFMLHARNEHVVRRVAASTHPKIAVVYGAAHSYGIVYFLKKNHGFRQDKNYKAQ